MTRVITIKLTEAELAALDWLVYRGAYPSRSEALRTCMMRDAMRQGLQSGPVEEAIEERGRHLPRRSSKATLPRIVRDEILRPPST